MELRTDTWARIEKREGGREGGTKGGRRREGGHTDTLDTLDLRLCPASLLIKVL